MEEMDALPSRWSCGGGMNERGTFNEYLTTVDRLRRKGTDRSEAHWSALNTHWSEKASQIQGTDQDPRQLSEGEIDSWMGRLVSVWNRS